jgi:hypothetical protein
MAEFGKEDRDRFIRMETLLEGVSEVLFSDKGTARCATHTEKLSNLEKSVDKGGKWVKGIVIAMAGSTFIFILTVVYDLVTAAPTP